MTLSPACHAELKELVDRVKGDPDDAMLVSNAAEILNVCERHGQLYETVLHSKAVGVHPKNRDGEGLTVQRAISRGVKFKAVGFVHAIAERDTVGFEDHPVIKHIAKFTMKQCASQPGMAQYIENNIKIGPAGATHCNHFLAMVYDGSPCTEESIAEDGHMSQRKCFKDGQLANGVKVGMKWRVVRWPVEAAFSEIPTIIQGALNATAQMSEGDRVYSKIAENARTESKIAENEQQQTYHMNKNK